MGFLDTLLRACFQLFCGDIKSSKVQDENQGAQDVYVPTVVSHHPQPKPSLPSYHPRPDAEPVVSYPPPARPHEHRPEEGHTPPHRYPSPGRVDQNQVNQQNEHYKSLRARANEEGDQMARSFEDSRQAYSRGDGALAKELSNKGKAHQREMERLNREASEWIFVENNKDSKPGEVDLHGLYVKEAITYTDRAIQGARQRGDSEVHLIVGKGLHSNNGLTKLKPAIEELVQKNHLVAELDSQNAGVLIVSLDGKGKGAGRVVQPDDITRSIENRDESCIIM